MNKHLLAAEALTKLLEGQFKIFGFRFGLDPVLGLVPGIGDVITTIMAAYLLWIAVELRVPTSKIQLMLWNILFDFFIGLIPVIGDAGDFVFKANSKNLRILKEHAQPVHPVKQALRSASY